jgi:hypothetical protein
MDDDFWGSNGDNDDEMIGYEPEYNEPEYDEGDDESDVDDEFTRFQESSEEGPDLRAGYGQYGQVSRGDVGLRVMGDLSRFEKLALYQDVGMKKQLYIQKLKAELSNYDLNPEIIDNFGLITLQIPRYWLKNISALVGTYFMIYNLNKPREKLTLTQDLLKQFSERTGIRIEDLYRYYKLVKTKTDKNK